MTQPLAGLRVVEVALGSSVVGAGLATSLPGRLLADLGAEVARVQDDPLPLDAGVESARVWDRGKERVRVGDDAAGTVRSLARDADVLLLAGPEDRLERQGLTWAALSEAHPRLVLSRLRPSLTAEGQLPDLELLVHARAGTTTQLRGARPGPVFVDLPVAAAGAGLSAAVGVLAALYEREASGVGGWVETSLYDGLQALLPLLLGRVEHPSAATRLLWDGQGPQESLCYRCADGSHVQLWFGAKGAYEQFLEAVGEPPSERGYQAELASGEMVERGRRWAALFATQPRDHWLQVLADRPFRCEPVLRPGEALRDPHVRATGLALDVDDPERGRLTVLGPTVRVRPAGGPSARPTPDPGTRLLSDVRVLDLSAFLAGPVAPLVLAGLGADVVKVEPPTGDAHRGMEPMYAAGQRGKRALALDLKSPQAAELLPRLFRWADVVHHNSRVGVAERLGYDAASVHAVNPDAVHSFASGFGETGPRALLPANDQLMQALSGMEASQAGEGNPPAFVAWTVVDVAGGWTAACGILAALYARRRGGGGQRVSSSLLGTALTLTSGAFLAGDEVVGGPRLDAAQTGYGAAYRVYDCADGRLAVATPTRAAWQDLARVTGVALPPALPAVRTRDGAPQPEEAALEQAFRLRPVADWTADLRAAGVPVEPVAEPDRAGFAARFLDDPVGRQLGRVVGHAYGERGWTEQTTFPPRLGPRPAPPAPAGIAALGEHTDEVLAELPA